MIILGLTGTLGSGKSTAAAFFAELGAVVIDADALARQVVEPGSPAYREILQVFGPQYLQASGSLNRKALATEIFENEQKRRQLEQIVHPRVSEERDRLLSKARPGDVVVLDVPLLFETGMDQDCDRTAVTLIDPEIRIQRLEGRGLSPREIQQRLESQLTQQEKACRADYTIDNSGSLEALRRQIESLFHTLKALANQDSIRKE